MEGNKYVHFLLNIFQVQTLKILMFTWAHVCISKFYHKDYVFKAKRLVKGTKEISQVRTRVSCWNIDSEAMMPPWACFQLEHCVRLSDLRLTGPAAHWSMCASEHAAGSVIVWSCVCAIVWMLMILPLCLCAAKHAHTCVFSQISLGSNPSWQAV